MIPVIILVRPEHAGNLGAVARAMKNMGLQELRLVAPTAQVDDLVAIKMAMTGRDVLEAAQIFPDLDSALENLDSVVATSRRLGKDRGNVKVLKEFAQECQALPKSHRVGILFGTEVTGLKNPEIARAQQIITIPSAPDLPSLNLAQAVLLVAYECFVAQGLPVPTGKRRGPEKTAKVEDYEGMVADLKSLLSESGFLDKKNPDHLMQLLRNMFNRAQLTDKEVRILRGICRQVRWWKEQA